MKVSASKLRESIYPILDEVLRTGIPVEIVHKGAVLKIVSEQPPSKLSRLKKRAGIVGDPEDLVHMGWRDRSAVGV